MELYLNKFVFQMQIFFLLVLQLSVVPLLMCMDMNGNNNTQFSYLFASFCSLLQENPILLKEVIVLFLNSLKEVLYKIFPNLNKQSNALLLLHKLQRLDYE